LEEDKQHCIQENVCYNVINLDYKSTGAITDTAIDNVACPTEDGLNTCLFNNENLLINNVKNELIIMQENTLILVINDMENIIKTIQNTIATDESDPYSHQLEIECFNNSLASVSNAVTYTYFI
jgi:hypothetical protein